AVVFIGEWVDAYLRDHGCHQSRPWQLLHGRRISRLLARQGYRQSLAPLTVWVGYRSSPLAPTCDKFWPPGVLAGSPLSGTAHLRPDSRLRGAEKHLLRR